MLKSNETIEIPGMIAIAGDNFNYWTQIVVNVNALIHESMGKPIAEAQFEAQSKVDSYVSFVESMDEIPRMLDVNSGDEYIFSRIVLEADLSRGILKLLPIWRVER